MLAPVRLHSDKGPDSLQTDLTPQTFGGKWLLLSLAAIALIYALTIPQNFTEAEDAVYYVEHVSVGLPAWHPNHLLFEPLNYAIVQGLGGDAMWVMQRVSLVAAMCSLALIWGLAGAAGAGIAARIAALWTVAGCFAFWLYGLYPDTYALPLPFVLASLLALSHQRVGFAAILAVCATLLHQSHVFLLPAGLLWILCAGADRKWAKAALYGFLFLSIIGVAYLSVGRFILGHITPFETLSWARGFASDGLWTPFSITAPIKALIGLATAVWSTLFLFGAEPLAGTVEGLFPGRMLVEEVFFAETGLRLGVWPLLALTGISVVSLSILALCAITPSPTRPPPRVVQLLALHGAIYASVITIWEPTNKEFWIAVLPMLTLVVFLRLDPMTRAMKAVAIVAVTTLWVANGAGAMVGFTDQNTDYWYQENRVLIENTNAGDVIVDDCGYICTGYLLLFSPADILPAAAFGDATEFGQGRVLITSRAVDVLDGADPALPEWARLRAMLQPLHRSGGGLNVLELPR